MTDTLLALLCRPVCRREVRLENGTRLGVHFESGDLVCAEHGAVFAIRDGIVVGLQSKTRTKQDIVEFWDNHPCMGAWESDTKQFEELREYRYATHPWIPEVGEFAAHVGHVVLEIGCSQGIDMREMLGQGVGHYIGLDISTESIQLARRRLEHFGLFDERVDLLNADAEILPLKPGSVDYVYSYGVIHHSENTPAIIPRIHEALRPGGRFCIMYYYKYSLTNIIEKVARGLDRALAALTGKKDAFWRICRLIPYCPAIGHYRNFLNTGYSAILHAPYAHTFGRRESRRMFGAFEIESMRLYNLTPVLRGAVIRVLGRRAYDALSALTGWDLVIKGRKSGRGTETGKERTAPPHDSRSRCLDLLRRMDAEMEARGFASHDPYDILGSPLVVWLRSRRRNPLKSITDKQPSRRDRLVRRILAPLYQTTAGTMTYRRLCGIRKVVHPKTMGLLLQAYARLARDRVEGPWLDKARRCASWLMENTDQHGYGKFCWGLPWVWPSGPGNIIPAFGPQSTMTAVIGLGFTDLFEAAGEQVHLDVARSACDFFMEHLRIDQEDPDRWALSYTPYDRTHILNVNLHCAALLCRVAALTGEAGYRNVARRITDFTVSHQRPDGAWHYAAPQDGDINAVDVYHTGDILEYLGIMRRVLDPFPYEEPFRRGVEFFLTRFFEPDGRPWYTETDRFPVDSHACCQALITLAALAELDPRALDMASRTADWITREMMDPVRPRMYYRRYETGLTDKTYAMAWGDAWMVKGLALLLHALDGASAQPQGPGAT